MLNASAAVEGLNFCLNLIPLTYYSLLPFSAYVQGKDTALKGERPSRAMGREEGEKGPKLRTPETEASDSSFFSCVPRDQTTTGRSTLVRRYYSPPIVLRNQDSKDARSARTETKTSDNCSKERTVATWGLGCMETNKVERISSSSGLVLFQTPKTRKTLFQGATFGKRL